MRILNIIFFCCLAATAKVEGQIPNTKYPATSPPPPKPTATAGNTGLRLLKIPVTGNHYLGMTRREYDSITGLLPLTIKTDKAVYALRLTPNFYGKRLLQLGLYIDSSSFFSDLSYITSYYETKLGPPDEKKESDTLRQFPALLDSSLNGEYRVKETTLTWRYKHHDIIISAWMADLRNGAWKGYYIIRYAGNPLFRSLLQELEYKEGY